jgi:hypothetical protein
MFRQVCTVFSVISYCHVGRHKNTFGLATQQHLYSISEQFSLEPHGIEVSALLGLITYLNI